MVSHNLLTTLPTWGPTFKVSLDIFINSFDGPNLGEGVWAEVLGFTNTTNNCCDPGDRLPAVFTHKNGHIRVDSQIGDNSNPYIGGEIYLKEKTWYKLEVAGAGWTGLESCLLDTEYRAIESGL